MIVGDPYLRCALASNERLLRKLHDYIVRHRLDERPALVVQACPVHAGLDIDVRGTQYSKLLADGSGRLGAWWNGFTQLNARVEPSFHGIELVSFSEDPKWASELHTDGHLVAGTWTFPELPDAQGKVATVVPYFFTELFEDFVDIVAKLQQSLASPEGFDITATLWRANQLGFGRKSTFGNNVTLCPPARAPTLQWRVRRAGDRTGLAQVATQMAGDLLGAYGVS
jgi:hypothetical protein